MNGLRTARVVIIDDEPNEAIPLFETLSRLEIGCVWVRGNRKEDLPDKPIAGIRLVFLDMDLDIGGTTSNKGKISATLGVLKRVVGENATPLMLVIWTKHKEMVTEFQSQFRDAMPAAGPGLIHSMEKPADPKDIDAKAILEEIKKLTMNCSPLELLWYWEQLAHDAASETTGSLATVVTTAVNVKKPASQEEMTKQWQAKLQQVLKSLIEASAGQTAATQSALAHLVETLNAIHLDRLQSAADANPPSCPKEILGKLPSLSDDERAAINTMLQTAKVNDVLPVRPGSVYMATPDKGIRCPVMRLKLDRVTLAKSCQPQYTAHKKYNELRLAIEKKKEDPNQSDELLKIRDEILNEIHLIAVEVSPNCDFSQDKRPVSRFVGGLIIPDSLAKVFIGKSPPPYLKAIKGIHLPGLDGVQNLLVNARFAFGIETPEKFIKTKPVVRLRTPVLIDLQAWLAAHMARPGYLVL